MCPESVLAHAKIVVVGAEVLPFVLARAHPPRFTITSEVTATATHFPTTRF
jgi:hypothetical protein